MAGQPLNSREQIELAERLAELAQSGMPLPEGLRAAARQTKSRRLAAQLRRLSARIESGASWEEVLLKDDIGLPPHVLGVIRAGIRSRNLGDALDGLIDHQRVRRDLWRQLFWALAYPLMLVISVVALFVFALMFVVRPMEQIYADFGTELPALTVFWIELSRVLPQAVFWVACAGLIAGLLIRMVGGRIGWTRFVSTLPIFGPMVHWSGAAEMMRLLHILLVHDVQLPEALRLTASGVSDANMALVSRWLADGTEHGIPLAELMNATPRIPAFIVPLVNWGEREGSLAQATQGAHELLEGRIRMRNSLVSVLLSPLMLIVVAAAVALLIIGLFMPLVSLIQNLT